MLKEFVEALASQAVRAATPQLEETDRTSDYAVRTAGGDVRFIKGEPARRTHAALDLETCVAFAQRFSESALWYSRASVVCLIDDDDRRDMTTMTLTPSAQIVKLQWLESSQPLMGQRDLLFMLRTVFPGALEAAPKLIDLLRNIRFESGAVTTAVSERGKSSIGKAIAESATFLDTLPECVTLYVPVIVNGSLRRSVRPVACALEVFEGEQKFKFFPLPGEVERAFSAFESELMATLHSLLGESKVPIYYGKP